MRIAILGTRGVPAAYGGFETFAEELGARLVERGHVVTVYGRRHVIPAGLREHRGMRLRVLPTIRHKYLDTVAHTALSVIDALPRRFDVALNVDGLEWERGKWGPAGRLYYQACAWLAPKLPITLVSDARVIARWYQERYGKRTAFIPYGSDARVLPSGDTLTRLGLEPGQYLLYVSRLEPENNAHIVMDGYIASGVDLPLVVVGDAPYATDYKRSLEERAAAHPGIWMTGYVFGDRYAELQSNAMLYVQATEVGGTHPALVEAMGRGACILANDVPEHREVLGEAGRYYARNDVDALATVVRDLVADPAARVELGAAASARAQAAFSWNHVTDEYERLFMHLRPGGRVERRRPHGSL